MMLFVDLTSIKLVEFDPCKAPFGPIRFAPWVVIDGRAISTGIVMKRLVAISDQADAAMENDRVRRINALLQGDVRRITSPRDDRNGILPQTPGVN